MSMPFQPIGDGRRVFTAPKNLTPATDLTPLIDVVFQLLLFFMLSSTFIKPALDIELPKASSGKISNDENPLVLSVSSDGAINLNGELLARQELQQKLAAALASRQDAQQRAITLRADAAIAYGEIVEIMDLARRAGAISLKLEYLQTGE